MKGAFSWLGHKLDGHEKVIFALFIALALLAAATEATGVGLMAQVLDMIGEGRNFTDIPFIGVFGSLFEGREQAAQIKIIAVVLGAAVVLRGGLDYASHAISAAFPLRIAKRLNLEAYARMQDAELSFVQERPYGRLQNAVQTCAEQVAGAVTSIANIISNVVLLSAYVVLAALISIEMTVGIMVMFGFMFWLRKITIDKAVERAAATQLAAAAVRHGVLQESVGGAALIRLSAAEERMKSKYAKAAEEFRRAQYRQQLLRALTAPTLVIVSGLTICVLLFGVGEYAGDRVTQWIAQFLLFVAVLFRILRPTSAINSGIAEIAAYLPGIATLMSFELEAERRRQRSGTQNFERLSGGVRFESVNFKYGDDNRFALEDVSFDVPKGSMIALVGHSGAGKSTIVSLLARLVDPPRGAILIDGVDLLDYDTKSWRKRISIVSQEIFIFNETVSENIAFGTNATEKDIRWAARFAAADDFIRTLPDGYDTVLGERGFQLSGGQRQRLGIARAVVTDPELLIMDEATNQLDSVTENAIQRGIEYLSKDRTVVVVAHRLSTIKCADKVVVLEAGRVVEMGTHAELGARDGVYAEMLHLQDLDELKRMSL